MTRGLRITRRFTMAGIDPYDRFEWSLRDSKISNPDGSVVFEMSGAEIPAQWSQVASDIMVSKYFRKAGVPQVDADGRPVLDAEGHPVLGPERSARQVFDRLAATWRHWGEKEGYFAGEDDAQAFEDELKYMLAAQVAAPNSPQWFNTGLNHAYGLTGPAQGFWYVDSKTGEMTASPDSYSRPAPHACFPAGARVMTREGFTPIEKIEPGDLVLTHEGRYQHVVETMQRQIDEDLVRLHIGNQVLTATQNHPLLRICGNEIEWVAAGDIGLGDAVFTMPNHESGKRRLGTAVPALRIDMVPFSGTVYNLQVEEDESYVVDGVVVHNCFILSVKDDLVNPGGIMDLWVREARIFKFGSGAGSNFSSIRAENERLSGGGKSSGVMSFLKIGDRAAGAIKCLHADTEIVTGKGTFPIKEVEVGDAVVTRHGSRTVTAVHDNGVRPLKRVRTALGDEILATPEHRFWVRGPQGEEWKEVRDLTDSDYVALDLAATPSGSAQVLKPIEAGHHNAIGHDLPSVINEPFALWLGWVAGDGSVTTRPGAKFVAVQIGDKDPELTDRYIALVKGVFGKSAHVFVKRARREDRSASVRLASSQVIRFLEANGLRKDKASKVTIPSLVKSSPATVRAAYLSGLFEAGGHIDNGYPVLSTISADLARDVHRLLIGLGIPSTIRLQANRPGALGAAPLYLVRVVSGEGVRRFDKLVGFVSDRKQSELERAMERKDASPYETQWVLPYAVAEMGAIWHKATGRLRRAIAPYCRYAKPRSLSLLRARALVSRFPEELAGTLVERFAQGDVFYQKVSVEPAAPGRVFDLTVEGVSEYTVHGLVTHNSGGTTRRAAKMVILDIDHPDIEKFIDWKKVEEEKARVLIQHGGFPADFNGDAYATVSGQNSNNSVRVTNDFIQAVLDDAEWDLINRTDGSVRKTVKARDLWTRIADAAWACADPGLQFDTTINEWHTSPAGGRIRASNPCSEYMYLDDTACNLASINLVRFYDDETGVFDVEAYVHAIRLWTIVLEISVAMAHFPSSEIAQGSYDYRTLGLGYANLGSLLMRQGIAYDSDKGRAIAGALTAILTGEAYATSAEIAGVVGPFPRFAENREAMLRVIRNHRRAAYGETDFEGVSHRVMTIEPALCPPDLLAAARSAWDTALDRGELAGYRNAQSSVIAPTGTIGLLLDCDTTGVEPDFALVKFKKLAGGGYFKIVNQSVTPALRRLGYAEDQIRDVVEYIVGTSTIEGAPHINTETLTAKGFDAVDLAKLESVLPAVFELRHAFNVFTFGEETLQRLGFDVDEYTGWDFNLLKALGFTQAQINEANDHICGRQTIEGAPHVEEKHLAVFDTANKNGKYGRRFIHHNGHILMMAAAQPFISGAISKTINMPNEITVEDIEEAYRTSWELGLKAMAIYRDGSKAAQPLNSTSDEGEESEDEPVAVTAAVEKEKLIHWGNLPKGISPTQAYAQGMQPPRFLLPARRNGFNQEARVGGHKLYLRTGEYEDGTLGEIFIDLAKEGATLKGILSCFAIAVSKGLQYGVPLDEFVDTFTFQTFEPRGMVEGHPNIKMANSIIDYVFRALGVEYLQRDELAQVPPNREGELAAPPKGLAIEAGVQLDLTDAAGESEIELLQKAAEFVDAPETASVVAPPAGQPTRSTDVVEGGSSPSPTVLATKTSTETVDLALKENMGDAPVCSNCGHMTIRNGSCYVCLTCGDTTGCS
ncbi:MAG: Hint domain-containing protein [Actinobacteria bacterium]|nr:Hint domain-containing protein [Actinomycetota bacterium]